MKPALRSTPRGLTLLEVAVLLFMLAVLASVVIVIRGSHKKAAQRMACVSNLETLGKAMFMYAALPANKMLPTLGTAKDPFADQSAPATLALLHPSYVADARVFLCPGKLDPKPLKLIADPGRTPPQTSYAYDPGHARTDPAILLADMQGAAGENSDNHGENFGQNVLLPQGVAEWREYFVNLFDDGTKDDSIFKLDPLLPRPKDSYLRR